MLMYMSMDSHERTLPKKIAKRFPSSTSSQKKQSISIKIFDKKEDDTITF